MEDEKQNYFRQDNEIKAVRHNVVYTLTHVIGATHAKSSKVLFSSVSDSSGYTHHFVDKNLFFNQ